MTISILESFEVAEGGSYTLGQTGTIVLVGNGESAYTSRPLVGLTFGGITLTEVIASGTTDPKGGVWLIKEVDIPVGSATLVADWDGKIHNTFVGTMYVLSGVDQVSPVIASNKNEIIANGNELDLFVSCSEGGFVAVSVGTYSILVGIDQSSTTANSTLPLVYDLSEQANYFSAFTARGAVATDGVKTVGVRLQGSDINKSYAAVASFKPAASTTTETLDNVLVEPLAGKQFVTIGATPDLTYKSLLYGTDPAAVTGDQLESDTLTSDGKAITLNTDGTFSIANVGTNVQTFQYRIHDADGDGWSAMATATVTPQAGEPDTTKPNIALIGSSTVFVDIGGTFTDQGALVTDNVDANTTIYSNVTVTTASANTFTLPYDYTDSAGNVGDTAYRTVVVRDPNEVAGSAGILRPVLSPVL